MAAAFLRLHAARATPLGLRETENRSATAVTLLCDADHICRSALKNQNRG